MTRTAVAFCALAFFLSGASALTYEILWQRQMFLVFGASAPATTAILTAIFSGIAFGSLWAAPISRRAANPLLLYAALEAVMAGWGLLVPAALSVADRLYVAATAAVGEGHPLQEVLRFVLGVVPLLPSTLAMGATVPVMIRCAAGTRSAAGWVYGVNILGAVAGGLATGFVWIERLGLSDTRFVAAGLNVAAAAVASFLATTSRHEAAPARGPASDGPVETPAPPRTLAALYFVSGFVALGLEVVWLRLLGIVNTNSSATFTLALTIYLLGMGSGSLLLYPLLRRFLTPRGVFGLANGATAAAALATFPAVYRAAAMNQESIVGPARAGTLTVAHVLTTEATVIAALMFLPTVFMGLAYPAVCDGYAAAGAARDRWVGRAYFWGTLGSVAGILLVATRLVPWLGLHGGFALLVSLSAAVATAAAVCGRQGRWAAGLAAAAVAGWAGAIASEARPVLRETAAVRRDGRWYEAAVAGPSKVLSELVRVKAGASATVMVKRPPGRREHLVYVDDQLVASTNLEAKVDSLMLAHLPLLLHPDPRAALTVGFGTGGTSHALTTHGVRAYCVEIEPEVPRAAHLIRDQNFDVLDDPRFTLILDDARDHLHAGTRAYDVIATDVTNLQYKQNASLYTVEYFELMRSRLRPGGVACAWIPMAAIDTRELRILMQSFGRAFPRATLWFMNHTHTNFGILIGTPGPLKIDHRRFAAGFANPEVAASLRLVGVTEPLQLVHCLHLDEEGYRAFCGSAPPHTDDRPILEFSSPLSFYRYHETFRDNLEATLRLRPTDFRRYVAHAPAGSDAAFDRHAAASRSFCEVLLRMYRHLIDRDRGRRAEATATLKEAIRHAEEGMRAWPEDTARERIYTEFFLEARRWLETSR